MAFSWQESTVASGTQNITCDIEYLDKSYIHVYLDGEETTAFSWSSDTVIRLNTALTKDTVVLLLRKTEREYLYIMFASGAPFIEANVDTQNKQFLHLAQELVEGRAIAGFYGDMSFNGYRITNVRDPEEATDAANKGYVDTTVQNEAALRAAADAALSATINANLPRSLRVPESSVARLPAVAARKNRLMAFDNQGDPAVVLPESGSAADVLLDLASNEDGLGGYLVNAARNPLAAAVKANTVTAALSALNVSIWEFASHVVDKPDEEDLNTWDWAPAIQAAFDYIGTYVPLTINGNTRHASACLQFPPGYYRNSSKVSADFSSYSGHVYGLPRVTIAGYGATIGCAVEQDFSWVIVGTLLNLSGLDFMTDSSVNYAYAIKLGDETKTTSNYAVTGVIRDVRGFDLTKFIVCGWAFDMRIEGPYATGFKQASNVSEPATAFEILRHVSDNCNNIVIIRPQFETTNTKNYKAFRIIGNSTLSTHHDIHIYSGHFESHQWGVRLISVEADSSNRPAVTRLSFNGMTLLENGATGDTTPAASTNLVVLERAHSCAFNSCIISTTNTTTDAYNSATHKSLIKYSGSQMRLVLDSCYFVTAFARVAGASNNRNLLSVVDTTEHGSGRYAVSVRDCTINNFSTTVSNGRVMSGAVSGGRKIIESISDDGQTWSLGYTTSDAMTGTVTDMISVSYAGVVTAGSFAAMNFDSSSAIRIGYNNTTPGQRSINFYGAGTTALTGQVYGNSAGSVTVSSTNNIFLSPNGGAGETQATGNIKPTAAASYNIGTAALPWKDGFFQNAITVVSDADHKPVIDAIPDAVLDIFDSLEIKRWKYDWAIAEKGEENARWHVGFVAQEVIEAFSSAGLNAQDYAFMVWREWDAEPAKYEQVLVSDAVTDPDTGEVLSEAIYKTVLVSDAVLAGGRWELVPHEINFILSAAHARRMKRIELLLDK